MSYTTYVLPFAVMRSNYMETFNEIIVLLSSYHLFVFTEWVYDVDQRYRMGWSLLCFVVFLLATNIAILAFVALKKAFLKSRKKYYMKRNMKILQKYRERRQAFENAPDDEDMWSLEQD